MYIPLLQTLLAGLLGGGSFGFIQFMITRHDSKKGKNAEILAAIERLDSKIDTLDQKINSVNQKGDERNAVSARVRILRFMDELLEGRRHSKDSYDQCLVDIGDYENYCDKHPKFKNNQTAATVEYIKKNYAERLEKHDFL